MYLNRSLIRRVVIRTALLPGLSVVFCRYSLGQVPSPRVRDLGASPSTLLHS